MHELRHAIRRLGRTSGFTAAVVLTAALVIGASAAIFTLVERIVLAPLPYPHADRLFVLDHAAPGIGVEGQFGMSRGIAREYAALEGIEALALYQSGIDVTIAAGSEPERAVSMRVSPSFSTVFGFHPSAGRWFTDTDSQRDAPKVAILAPRLAERLYGDAGTAVGRILRLDGVAYEIVGLTPAGFPFPDPRVQVLEPYGYYPTARAGGFGSVAVARLTPGVDPDAIRAQMTHIIATLPERFPGDPAATQLMGPLRLTPVVEPLKTRLLGTAGATLWMLMGAAVLVLLIACANLANLFFIRADARHGEWAVRAALGAGRTRAAAGFTWEAVLATLAGGAAGLALASFLVGWLTARVPFELPRAAEVYIGPTVAAVVMLCALAAGLAFGWLPLLRLGSTPAARLQDVLRGGTDAVPRVRWRQALVIFQVALTVVLLATAGLLARSFARVADVDPGFAVDGRFVFGLALPRGGPHAQRAAEFHERFLERVRALPGVRRAAVATTLPLRGTAKRAMDVEGRTDGAGDARAAIRWASVSSDYLQTLRVPLLRGRHFSPDETRDGGAVLINETVARAYFPGEDPLGQRVRPVDSTGPWSTIVGIIADTAAESVEERAPTPQLLQPLRTPGFTSLLTVGYIIESDTDPLAHLPGIRHIRDELDAEAAIVQPELLREAVRRSGARMGFSALLMSLAAVTGVLLGALGIYAVVGYGVALRDREIAIRLALGANRDDVSWMIVRQSAVAIILGLGLGLAAASAAGRAIEAQLFGVAWYDPLPYLAATSMLVALGVLASWIPAFRAASVSPVRLLR
jgi:putative ABC transport system permease protein